MFYTCRDTDKLNIWYYSNADSSFFYYELAIFGYFAFIAAGPVVHIIDSVWLTIKDACTIEYFKC